MHINRAIVWFRQDLRMHDNEALTDALKHADEIVPVFIFDERVFNGKTTFGFPKTGKFRARFIIESVADLRRSLRRLGSDLIVRVGKPEEIIFELAREVRSSWVFCNRERTREEVDVQDALEKNLWSIGQEMRYSRGKMLYYTADLPFPITHTPDTFAQFRKEVERYIRVRDPLPAPEREFRRMTAPVNPGDIPGLEYFGWAPFEADARSVMAFTGGESEGLRRLYQYFWESRAIENYEERRSYLSGMDHSSMFSPWLAQGCLSPKTIYWEIKKYEEEYGAGKSSYLLFYELMYRDFLRFMAKKYGDKIFLKGGIKGDADPQWRNDRALLESWIAGGTGVPFVDANMREIKHTGYMSNRGRQNVASFLVKDLGVNWQMGADYFESMLIDYDVASNWGNWNYIAGVGSDPREDKYFNILSQARTYDPKGEYIKRWIPELSDLPPEKIHQPETLSFDEQSEHHVRIGDDYPEPMVSTSRWG